jgi:LAS superfamily LD-carboxypeptidase LdcB
MRPVKRVVLPADLLNAKNGQLRPNLLRAIRPLGLLHHLAADGYHAMRAAALADGIRPFKPTSRADTYRTYQEQVALFNSRYTLTPLPGRPSKVWDGRRYWQKPNTAVAAVPGTSNHGLGLAVDIWSASGDRLDWLEANAITYGFSWEFTSGAEPWHLRYYRGDNVPKAVLEWKNAR